MDDGTVQVTILAPLVDDGGQSARSVLPLSSAMARRPPVPQLNQHGQPYGPCCLGRSNYTMANLPDTKACIRPSHRQRADESKKIK